MFSASSGNARDGLGSLVTNLVDRLVRVRGCSYCRFLYYGTRCYFSGCARLGDGDLIGYEIWRPILAVYKYRIVTVTRARWRGPMYYLEKRAQR